MKYENFDKAADLVAQISENSDLLSKLRSDNLEIKLLDDGGRLMTIGTWSSCEHECRYLASRFVHNLIEYYENKQLGLHEELEKL